MAKQARHLAKQLARLQPVEAVMEACLLGEHDVESFKTLFPVCQDCLSYPFLFKVILSRLGEQEEQVLAILEYLAEHWDNFSIFITKVNTHTCLTLETGYRFLTDSFLGPRGQEKHRLLAFFLNHGLNPNGLSYFEYPWAVNHLFCAVGRQSHRCMELLIQHGASVRNCAPEYHSQNIRLSVQHSQRACTEDKTEVDSFEISEVAQALYLYRSVLDYCVALSDGREYEWMERLGQLSYFSDIGMAIARLWLRESPSCYLSVMNNGEQRGLIYSGVHDSPATSSEALAGPMSLELCLKEQWYDERLSDCFGVLVRVFNEDARRASEEEKRNQIGLYATLARKSSGLEHNILYSMNAALLVTCLASPTHEERRLFARSMYQISNVLCKTRLKACGRIARHAAIRFLVGLGCEALRPIPEDMLTKYAEVSTYHTLQKMTQDAIKYQDFFERRLPPKQSSAIRRRASPS